MESQIHQTIGLITPDGDLTTSILTNAASDPPHSKNLVIDHIYGMISPASTSSTNLLQSPSQSSPFVPSVRGRSKVWNEFSRTEDGKKVTCHRCGDCLAYSNSHSTSSMLKHLKRKHDLDLYPSVNGNEQTAGGESNGGGGGIASGLSYQTDPKFSASSSTAAGAATSTNTLENKRMRSSAGSAAATNNGKSVKRNIISKDAEEIDTSIQHGPLLFKDPCVRMKWTDHSDTFLRTFSSLYSDESYTDVTLVAENHFFKAHRVILSSASEFFDESFRMTPSGQHPIIFLKDVKAMEFRILLDFIYKGEVSIPPSLIPCLVKVGSDLRVRGLSDFVWNEQLANSVFQAKPQAQQPPPPATETRRFIQKTQQSTNLASQFINDIPLSSHVTPVRLPVRTLIRQPVQQQQQQLVTSNHQQNDLLSQPTRLYSRIVNIRQTNATTAANAGNGNVGVASGGVFSSNALQGQIISGDLSNVCSSVATSFPNMKRIRIVTSESRLPSSQIRHVPEGTAKMVENTSTTGGDGGGAGGRLLTSQSAAAATTSSTQSPETVLMVSNEGETLLSTSQGGVTVLSQPNSALNTVTSMSLNQATLLQERDSHQQEVVQQQQQQLRPVITAVTSQAHHQSGNTITQGELDEVVYSIGEIPEDDEIVAENGSEEEHQIILHQDQEMDCDNNETASDSVDRKPFLHDQ